ncbi:site-specific integrase [Lachnospiraceae bacterium]|nr:site-specific integrase [Lachnospiraceae bacterium]
MKGTIEANTTVSFSLIKKHFFRFYLTKAELLALTPADIDFQKQTVTISKTFHRSKGRDIITSPKTKKSNRTIKMPPFLCEEMQEYIKMLYDIKPDERLFTVTKSYLNHEMERGAKQAGVKKIRVHDIRHSAVSLLINMGFSVLAIGERMGHEAEKITYRYAHLFPTVQTEMAEKLEMERMTKEENPLLLQGQSHFPAENRED